MYKKASRFLVRVPSKGLQQGLRSGGGGVCGFLRADGLGSKIYGFRVSNLPRAYHMVQNTGRFNNIF